MPVIRESQRRVISDSPRAEGVVEFLRESFAEERQNALWPVWKYLLGGWIVVAAATPYAISRFGSSAFSVTILLWLAVTLVSLRTIWQPGITGTASALMLAAVWIIEITAHGYSYTNTLTPRLLGIPVITPFLWLALIAPSWGLADMMLMRRRDWFSRLRLTSLSASIFTATALSLGPVLARWGFATWDGAGIPWRAIVEVWTGAAILTLVVRPLRIPRMRLATVCACGWAVALVWTVWSGDLSPWTIGALVAAGGATLAGWAVEYHRWRWTANAD